MAYVRPVGLAQAFHNVRLVRDHMEMLYLDNEFGVFEEPVAVDLDSLINKLPALVLAPGDPIRLDLTKEIVSILKANPAIAGSFKVAHFMRTDAMLTTLQEARQTEIIKMLQALDKAQAFTSNLFATIECAYHPSLDPIRASAMDRKDVRALGVTSVKAGKKASVPKETGVTTAMRGPKREDLVTFIGSPEGLAILARIPGRILPSGKLFVNFSNVSNEDLEMILRFQELLPSGAPRAIQTYLGEFCQMARRGLALSRLDKKLERHKEINIFGLCKLPGIGPLLHSQYPGLERLLDSIDKKSKTYGTTYDKVTFCRDLHKSAKEFQRRQEEAQPAVNRAYRDLYEEYQLLASNNPTVPTPEQFAEGPFGFTREFAVPSAILPDASSPDVSSIDPPHSESRAKKKRKAGKAKRKAKGLGSSSIRSALPASATTVGGSSSGTSFGATAPASSTTVSSSSIDPSSGGPRAKKEGKEEKAEKKAKGLGSSSSSSSASTSSTAVSSSSSSSSGSSSSSSASVIATAPAVHTAPASSGTVSSSSGSSSSSSSSSRIATAPASSGTVSSSSGSSSSGSGDAAAAGGADPKRSGTRPSFLTPIFAGRRLPFADGYYAKRILDWRGTVPVALKGEKYKNRSPLEKDEAVWRHAGGSYLDKFVGTKYSMKGTWLDPETGLPSTLYRILVEVRWRKGPAIPYVLEFSYNVHGVLYHRHFADKTKDELLDVLLIRKKFEEVDFPTLAKSHALSQSKEQTVRVAIPDEEPLDVTMDKWERISFTDPKYQLDFRIIKFSDT